jgi:hypothetical protein
MSKRAKIKKWLKPLQGFGIGVLIGLCFIGTLFAVPELRHFITGEMSERGMLFFMTCWFGAMLVCVAAVFLLIIFHEAGHLVFGLLSGFRMVSFRVANIILVRHDEGWQFGRFSIAGTGGQCLMEPAIDDMSEAHHMPYAWYLAGGVIANIVVTVISIIILSLHVAGVAGSCILAMLSLSGVYLAITNGIPMKIGGVANDGDNIRILKHNAQARRLLWVQLKANAVYTRGARFCDMPEEWFSLPNDADPSDYFNATVIGMRASREIELLNFEAAYANLQSPRAAGSRLLELLQMETACELLLPAIMLHRPRYEIEALMDEKTVQYARTYAHYMLSRAVTIYVYERFVKCDKNATEKALQHIERMASRYPTKGEQRSCCELVAYLKTLNDEDYAIN